MKPAFVAVLSLLLPVAPVIAQSVAQLKKELKTKEADAKKDPDKLCEVAAWASEKGMVADAKRIFQAVLKINPDHEGANEGLGNASFEGKWMPKKQADELRRKKLVAEFQAKGMVEVDGVWVEKENADEAKKGIFRHEGEVVSKEEKMALLEGKVRHPDSGEMIDAKFLDKAKAHYFPIGREGRWVDQKEADTYHSDFDHPWFVRTVGATIVTTIPMEKILELKAMVDRGIERVAPLFGSAPPLPANRPAVMIAITTEEYQQLGTALGDETSSTSAFLMREEARLRIPSQGELRAGICIAKGDWAPYNVRHAAGLAYVQAKCADADATVPLWFLHGAAAYASRFENDYDAGHFGKQHIQKGGVKNLKSWFSSFAINGEMEPKDIDYNLYQAGLIFHFATQGGDAAVTDAMQAVTKAFEARKSSDVEKAIAGLTKILIASEEKMVAHLQKLVASVH
ncbi:MAG: hypothetical protein U1E73_02315 [Planctomycetota bacterium]